MLDQRTSIPARTHDCQPWCTDHANAGSATRWPQPEDQVCRRVVTSPAFGEFLMTRTIDDGSMVNLYNTNLELTIAEARRLAYAVLAATDGVAA